MRKVNRRFYEYNINIKKVGGGRQNLYCPNIPDLFCCTKPNNAIMKKKNYKNFFTMTVGAASQ